MSKSSISLDGEKALLAALRDMSDDIAEAVAEVVQKTAAEIEAGGKLRMQQGPATGRTYKRGKVVHRASDPGEPPAPDTGALIGSIYHEKTGRLSAVVGSRLAYAAFLEWGTFKMEPRPAWDPEVDKARSQFITDVENALGAAIK